MMPSANNVVDIEAMSEDDELLRETEEEEDKRLLALRKSYKRNQSNLTKIKSHLSFIRGCRTIDKTPKDLRVGVTCNALLSDMTAVRHKFNSTKVSAESEYVQALEEHYIVAEQTLQSEARTLVETMTREASRVKIEVKRRHEDMLKKTEENVRKLMDAWRRPRRRNWRACSSRRGKGRGDLQPGTGIDLTAGMPHPNRDRHPETGRMPPPGNPLSRMATSSKPLLLQRKWLGYQDCCKA